MPHPDMNPDAGALEDAFFAQQDRQLLERLREQAMLRDRREALRAVAPNADDALLDRLMAMNIGPETVLALLLVPLTVVAWADGSIDPRERSAILRAAEQRGIVAGSPAHTMLNSWLERKHGSELVDAWKRYVRTIWGAFEETERCEMRERMLGMAREVAQAAGGFLGLTSRISKAEQAALDDLEAALP
jgi:hypothetical protein